MYLTSLPFDYTAHLDPGDRLRTTRELDAGRRIRRPPVRRPR